MYNKCTCMELCGDLTKNCYSTFYAKFASVLPRGFNKHRRPTKRVGYIAQRSQLLFSRKKEQIV